MEAVIFIGLQGSGKSTFYREHFFSTHVRISLDMLRTRHRELRLLTACLQTQQPFVIDNTNPTQADRAKYINTCRAANFSVIGYYFQSKADECLARNQQRTVQVPDVGVLATAKKLHLPSFEEGFDRLNYVRITASGFVVEEWRSEI